MKNDIEAIEAIASWHNWCRLCAKMDEGNQCIYSNQEDANTIINSIGRFFWVNIVPQDMISKNLCEECLTLISALVGFTERVNKVQSMFGILLKSDTDVNLDEIRNQFGLLEEDDERIIKKHNSEEIIFDDDNKQTETEAETVYELIEEQPCNVIEESDHINTELYKELKEIEQELEVQVENDNEVEVESDKQSLKGEIDETMNDYITMDDTEASQSSQLVAEDTEDTEASNSITERAKQANGELKRKRGRPNKNEVHKKQLKHEAEYMESIAVPRHKAQVQYECNVCDRKYKNPTSYRKHMLDTHKIEADIPDFICSTCSKVLPTEHQLAIHNRVHLSLEEKMDIPCPYCPKMFTKVAVMRIHVAGQHFNERPYVCDECGRNVKTKAALNEHKLTHTNVTPFECEICHKRFKNRQRLKTHSDIHTSTQYTCELCGLTLGTHRTLKMHMLVHSTVKNYSCDFCDAKFKRSKALKNHLIAHKGLRPYKCNFCDMSFTNGSNCRAHKKKKHAQELAMEEALGTKPNAPVVPNIEQLKTIITAPLSLRPKSSGLNPELRALIIAAEKRQQQDDLEEKDIPRKVVKIRYNQHNENQENCEEAEYIESEHIEEEQQEEDDETELQQNSEEETIIYEIINEV